MRMAAALRPVFDLPARLGLSHATDAYYALPVPLADERRPLAMAWLALGLAALVASGIFSLLLVAARTPFLAPFFPAADFFRVALVVHVDLSVLVWFAACAGLVWTVNGAPRFAALGWVSLAFAAVGTLLMSAAPFLGRGQPVMSNYVPVLDDPLFLAGLVVFGLGFAGVTLRALAATGAGGTRPRRRRCATLRPQRRRGVGGDRARGLRLVVARAPRPARRRALLRAPLLGRRPRAAVHLDAADARRVALARDARRPAAAARAARGGAPVRRRTRRGVRDAGDLSRVAGHLDRAPAAASPG